MQSADYDAGRMSESQLNCLCAVWLGSKGDGSNARTLDSLLRRGLVTVRQHQGAPLWETTDRGSDLAASILHPDDGKLPVPRAAFDALREPNPFARVTPPAEKEA